MWPRMAAGADKHGQGEHRDQMLAGLSGRVLELGCGHGANFDRYPASVSEVVGVEPEPGLRKLATEAAGSAPVAITVVDAVADSLPFEDASFDAAVTCLVLCSVPDQAIALAELRRVIKPGGELRFYEHVQAESNPQKAVLSFMQKTFWPHMAAGCHPARYTGEAIEAAGFKVEDMRRFRFSPAAVAPAFPHILGRARR
jgi:ubiquinone/menaquinone biosynthesis C-methylase UbiE